MLLNRQNVPFGKVTGGQIGVSLSQPTHFGTKHSNTFQRRCFHISASPQLSFLDFLHVRWHLVSLNICKLPCFHILGGPLSLTSAGFRSQGVSIRSSKVNITLTKPFISDIHCIFKAFICAPMHTITLEHAFSTCCLSEIIVGPGGEGT